MNTSVIDQPLSPGIISIDMAGQVFTHELPKPRLSPADNAIVLDLASPLYNPGATIDGVSKVYDRSGYGNHGTITGAAWRQLPSGLWYLSFDGNDYVNCGSGASLDVTPNLTVKAWIYQATHAASSRCLAQKGSGDADTNFMVYTNNGNLRFIHSDSGGSRNSTDTYPAGKWAMVTATIAGTALNYYFNDVADSGGTLNIQAVMPVKAATNLYMGAQNGNTKFWDGFIALPRVIKATLALAQIATIYNQERHLFGV